MAFERARAHAVAKPWGVSDLRPFSNMSSGSDTVGEIWYERDAASEASSALLLKLLFTSQPLSIQVHPDDAYAQSMGQRNGKTEAWYILSAAPGAKIAVGLKGHLSSQQLREAIDDGSISNLINWQAVFAGDSFLIPAGTIHAIGAGLVVAEIQQRSDVTFRLFDYGSQRELHTSQAVAVALTDAAVLRFEQARLTPERTRIAACHYFSMERIDLPPNSSWRLKADEETWMLGVSGEVLAGLLSITSGESAFVKSASFDFRAGPKGFVGLVAYVGDDLMPDLLTHIGSDGTFGRGPQITAAARPAGLVQ